MAALALRPYQQDAVAALARAIGDGGRAQVVMAMGTGKTLVGRAAAARLVPDGGVVVVLVPSLALVFQTLHAWQQAGDITDILAVCSGDDPSGTGSGAGGQGRSAKMPGSFPGDSPGTRTTTDPESIAAWLLTPRRGTRLLLATYHSVPRIKEAFRDHGGLSPLDLIIFDEAHRAAADPRNSFATALHDEYVPAARRLFLTATPRRQVGDPDDPYAGEVFEGMSDEGLFGPVVYELTVAEAISKRMLSDYKVVVVGVTDAQAHKLVIDNAPLSVGPKETSASTIAVQIALAQSARSYDLRRVLVFHNRVASSRDFAAVLPHTNDALPADLRPDGYLTVHHIDGTSGHAERAQALGDLAVPEAGGWTVVSNVQVLSEGVDCPALDAVVFADPREGQTSVIQAIGRALRLHPERDQPAVILIPVYLAPGENGGLVAEDSDYRAIWQILTALRAQDRKVDTQIVAARRDLDGVGGGELRPVLPDWLDLHVPGEAGDEFLRAFTTHLLDGDAHIHGDGLEHLRAYAERYGHACPGEFYRDETGYRLGRWVKDRRREYASGRIYPGLAAELEAVSGWKWRDPRTVGDRMIAALTAYAVERGHTHPPLDYRSADGDPLGAWTYRQRHRYRAGLVTPDRRAALEAVPGWNWQNAFDEQWEANLARLRAFAEEFGHTRVKNEYRTPDDSPLGNWVAAQRRERSRLSDDRTRALESVPYWRWTHAEAYTDLMLIELARYHAEHGAVPVPRGYRPKHDHGLTLGNWLANLRKDFSADRMEPGLVARFEAIPGFTWGARDSAFRELLSRLRDYAAEHGALNPPTDYETEDGFLLERKIRSARASYRAGSLSKDRIKALESIPDWSWEAARPRPRDTESERFAAAVRGLRAYAAENGTCVIPPRTRLPDGRDLWNWAQKRREEYRSGQMPADKADALESVPGWYWDYEEHKWQQNLALLRDYAAEHGTADVPKGYYTDDRAGLGPWVSKQRSAREEGTMTAEHKAALESVPGWSWS